MSRRSHPQPRRRARLLVLGGLLASAVPISGAPGPLSTPAAHAADGGAAATSYGGFTASAWSSPVRIEVFEPSVPVPVDAGKAQMEFLMGYSKVQVDSGLATGRASLFWPGDPVGEGLKTFAEQLGFPPSPLTDRYPVQVNSQYPGDTPTQKDEQIPGSIQRTTAGERTAVAEAGFSPDGAVAGPDSGSGDGSGGGGAADPLTQLSEQLQGLAGGASGAAESSPVNPLAALVDLDGYVSVSRADASEGPVTAVSRTTLGEVRLLGGLVTLGGVESVVRTTTDGATAKATGKTVWGTMTVGGQEFSIGPDGAVVGGQPAPIPGLEDAPADALEQLGITIEVPKPVRTVEGDLATSQAAGPRITIDTAVLAPVLKALPAGALAELVPADAGPLRGLVAGLATLSPKVVLTLGAARASVDTVPPISVPPPPDVAAPPTAAAGPAPAAGTVGVPPAAGPAPAGAAPAPAAGTPVTDLVDAAPASAGLPQLFSIPGMLLLAAFAAAAVAGSWFRRLGVAALGAGAPCAHGLESGLPDLRKA